ncbi:MAG: hypothetical protein LBH24_01715 [Clostridiales bacterium]|jgi:hypothetical protein|nr:hypothetical protein [Clostridiales bacterium]
MAKKGKNEQRPSVENRLFGVKETEAVPVSAGKAVRSAAVRKKKKKMNGGLKALLVFVSVILVLILLLSGGALIAGDYFAREYLDMSIWDCIGIVSDLYNADEKKLLDNKPGENDALSLYKTFDRQLFLKEGTMDEEMVNKLLSSVSAGAAPAAAAHTVSAKTEGAEGEYTDGDGEPENGEPEDGENEDGQDEDGDGEGEDVGPPPGNDEIAAIFDRIIRRENLDEERLFLYKNVGYGEIEAQYRDDFLAYVTDKEMMAVLTVMLDRALSGLEGDAARYVSLLTFEQVKLKAAAADKAPAISLVASIALREAVGSMLDGASLPDFVRSLVEWIVPKKLFVTAELFLGESLTADIYINHMDEAKADRAFKLVDKIVALTGNSAFSARAAINDLVNDAVGDVVKDMDGYLDFNRNIDNGRMYFDVYGLIATSAFSGREVGGVDIAYLLVTTLSTEYEDMLDAYADAIFHHNFEEEGAVVFDPAREETGAIDYGVEFMSELREKYLLVDEYYVEVGEGAGEQTHLVPMIFRYLGEGENDPALTYRGVDLKGATAERLKENDFIEDGQQVAVLYVDENRIAYTEAEYAALAAAEVDVSAYRRIVHIPTELKKMSFADFAAFLGLGDAPGGGPAADIMSLFDAQGFTKKPGGAPSDDPQEWFVNLYGESGYDGRLIITDKMLAALVDTQFNSIVKPGENDFLSAITLDFVKILTEERDGAAHHIMEIGVSVGIAAIGANVPLVQNLLGERIGFSARFDITLGLTEDEYLPAEYGFNGLSAANTNATLEILNRLGVAGIRLGELEEKLCRPVRSALDTMNGTLGGITFDTGNLKMQDIYDTLAHMVFPENPEKTDEEGRPIVIEGRNINDVLKGLYNEREKIEWENEDPEQETYEKIDFTNARQALENQGQPLPPGFDPAEWLPITTEPLPNMLALCGDDPAHPFVGVYDAMGGDGTFNDRGLAANMDGYRNAADSTLYYNFAELIGAFDTDRHVIDTGTMYLTYRFELAEFLSTGASTDSLLSRNIDITFVLDKSVMANGVYQTKMYINAMSDEHVDSLENMIAYLDAENYQLFMAMPDLIGAFAYSYNYVASVAESFARPTP